MTEVGRSHIWLVEGGVDVAYQNGSSGVRG